MPLSFPASMSAANLGNDPTFRARVKSRLYSVCQLVYTNNGQLIDPNEVALYVKRKNFAIQVLQSMYGGAGPDWSLNFAEGVAQDVTIIQDVTSGFNVDITGPPDSNASVQQTLAPDAHIDAAINAQFNSYIQAA